MVSLGVANDLRIGAQFVRTISVRVSTIRDARRMISRIKVTSISICSSDASISTAS
jgi:hypothetical protein